MDWTGLGSILHCAALLCTALLYPSLLSTALHCLSPPCTALHCLALHCAALHCPALSCTALHCTALHCTAVHGRSLHCTALHCIGMPCIAMSCLALPCMGRHPPGICAHARQASKHQLRGIRPHVAVGCCAVLPALPPALTSVFCEPGMPSRRAVACTRFPPPSTVGLSQAHAMLRRHC